MRVGENWTTAERAEVNGFCRQNHEALLRMDFMLGGVRPMNDLSTKDCLFVVGLQIEHMDKKLIELETILLRERIQAKEGAQYDRS